MTGPARHWLRDERTHQRVTAVAEELALSAAAVSSRAARPKLPAGLLLEPVVQRCACSNASMTFSGMRPRSARS